MHTLFLAMQPSTLAPKCRHVEKGWDKWKMELQRAEDRGQVLAHARWRLVPSKSELVSSRPQRTVWQACAGRSGLELVWSVRQPRRSPIFRIALVVSQALVCASCSLCVDRHAYVQLRVDGHGAYCLQRIISSFGPRAALQQKKGCDVSRVAGLVIMADLGEASGSEDSETVGQTTEAKGDEEGVVRQAKHICRQPGTVGMPRETPNNSDLSGGRQPIMGPSSSVLGTQPSPPLPPPRATTLGAVSVSPSHHLQESLRFRGYRTGRRHVYSHL